MASMRPPHNPFMPRRPPGIPASDKLFSDELAADAPLAARMRPRTCDDFVGQPHLVGDDGALTRLVSPGHRPLLILWGPPGNGKTTPARLESGPCASARLAVGTHRTRPTLPQVRLLDDP